MTRSGGVALRAVAAAVGVTGLLIVVALIAGSVPDSAPAGRDWQIDRAGMAAVMQQVLFVVYLAILAHAFHLWLTRRDRSERSSHRLPGAPPLAVLLVLLLLLALAVLGLFVVEEEIVPGEEGARPTFTTFSPEFEGGGAPLPGGVPDSTSPRPDWPVLLAGLAVAGIVAAAVVARGRPVSDGSEFRIPSPPEAVTGTSQAQAPPSADPRERVFAAYQTVQDAAGHTGHHRHHSETVSAHLRRLAPSRTESAGRLAALYNQARFSSHVIGVEDATGAERAGDEIRRRLR